MPLIHDFDELRDSILTDKNCWWRDSDSEETVDLALLKLQACNYAFAHGGLLPSYEDYHVAFPIRHVSITPTFVTDLISVRAASLKLKCSPATIYAAIKREELTLRRAGDKVTTMVSEHEVDEWTKSRMRLPYNRKQES